jgi:drug/metabolite transporter superfamily protein YnfA
MTQNILNALQAVAYVALVLAVPAAVAGGYAFVLWLRRGPVYRVESPVMPSLVEMHWTRRQAVTAAREITDEVGVQFSVIEIIGA